MSTFWGKFFSCFKQQQFYFWFQILLIPFSAHFIFCSFHFLLIPNLACSNSCSFQILLFPFLLIPVSAYLRSCSFQFLLIQHLAHSQSCSVTILLIQNLTHSNLAHSLFCSFRIIPFFAHSKSAFQFSDFFKSCPLFFSLQIFSLYNLKVDRNRHQTVNLNGSFLFSPTNYGHPMKA